MIDTKWAYRCNRPRWTKHNQYIAVLVQEEVGVAKWVDSYHQEKAANAASETVEQADPN